MELAPGQEVDRYVVEKLLGRGGMASVWKVRRVDLGVEYALKVLAIPGRAFQDRLREEGRIQASLRHPNIVSVVDVLSLGGSPALVLEYVDGPSLEALLRAHRLDADQIDEVARGILKGVRAAHRAGFVHRDLKPGNVLMARTDDGFVPKIADFGLAKLVRGEGASPSRTRTGAMMGTPAYMAPEQFRNARDVDERADVYALGVILYELCTGAPPFDASDFVELVDRVRAKDYVRLADAAPDLPPRMARAIEGAMEVDRDRRLQDVQAVYDAWTGRGGHEPPTSRWDRALLRSFDEPQAARALHTSRETLPPPSALAAAEPRPARAAFPPASPRGAEPPLGEPRGLGAIVALTGAASAAAVAASVMGLLALVAVALWSALSTPSAAPAPAPVAPPAPVAAPAPAPAPPAPAPPLPDPVPAPGPAPIAAPAPSPRPASPHPAPVAPHRPAPVARSGTVRVTGDATVELRDAQGRVWPVGAVPAGTWSYTAHFPSGASVDGAPFGLDPGATRTIACDATFGNSCKVR